VNLRLRLNRRGAALVILFTIVALAALAPVLARDDPRDTSAGAPYAGPSWDHPLGTDLLGRDVASRVLYGGRRTLALALLTIAVTFGPGAAIGLTAGYFRGWIDTGLMLLMDALLAFPALLMALALVAVLGSGPVQIALAVGIAGIPAYARVTRAAVLEARSRLYVEAARAAGARPGWILLRHVAPGITPTLLSFAAVSLSWALLNSAALMFLGYGGDIGAPEWGVMLSDGRYGFRSAPWAAIAPGVALSVTVFAINLLGSDGGPGRG
jgi:peptide/nickel transport system permease protein